MDDDVEWLPLGSVVTLTGGSRRVMVVGRVQRDARTGVVYDYSGCPWPQGMVDSTHLIVFNRRDVAQVHGSGFVDGQESTWALLLDGLRERADESPVPVPPDAGSDEPGRRRI